MSRSVEFYKKYVRVDRSWYHAAKDLRATKVGNAWSIGGLVAVDIAAVFLAATPPGWVLATGIILANGATTASAILRETKRTWVSAGNGYTKNIYVGYKIEYKTRILE